MFMHRRQDLGEEGGINPHPTPVQVFFFFANTGSQMAVETFYLFQYPPNLAFNLLPTLMSCTTMILWDSKPITPK